MSDLSSSSLSSSNSFSLEQAFKHFFLETDHLQMAYQAAEERFRAVQTALSEFHTRFDGKLAELDFTSRYLETILNHISQGILFIDVHGVVTTYNTAAQAILQIPEKDLLFHSLSDFFKDTCFGFSLMETFSTRKCPRNSVVTWEREGEGERLELEIEATFVTMSQEAYPLDRRQAIGAPIQGLLILLRDLTPLRQLQRMTQQQARLKELGELAAHLAHEIRNPLGGIKGFASLLQQELRDKPDLQAMALSIVQGADGLNQFVSQILFYARPFQPHMERTDLVSFIEQIAQLMKADVHWNEKMLFVLESACSPLFVSIDPQLFRSALLNLFLNAAQAMPEGGTLRVQLEENGSWVILKIEDTGVGITPEHLSKIFSPFFTTKETGTGLGLAEVQKVVQAHQGWIEVQSTVKKGTTFIIKIPSS